MDTKLIQEILQLNPWLQKPKQQVIDKKKLINRIQTAELLHKEWDSLWTLLVGPRRAGKTTLGMLLAQELLTQKRYTELLYLSRRKTRLFRAEM